MQRNVGQTDRVIRIVLGTIILMLGIGYRKAWGIIGFILILSGITQRCLCYVPFGINTRRKPCLALFRKR
jgi:hypothetical protein